MERLMAGLRKKKKKKSEKGGVELIEEAVHLLRAKPGILSLYYTGSLPFILGFLYFIGDMSRNSFAEAHCVAASLGLAFLFIWMKSWHSVFAVALCDTVNRRRPHPWSIRGIVRLVYAQTVIQSTGLVLNPVAAVLGVIGWVTAFYHNALVLEYDKPLDLKKAVSESVRISKYRPGQNHIILYVLSLFFLFVFVDVGVAVFFFPYILKNYFGIETLFTMSGINALNTTFLAAVTGITFLCLDPLVKAIYVLRYFYGLSVSTGDDLKAGLKNHTGLKITAALFVIAGCLFFPWDLSAGENTAASYKSEYYKTPVSPGELDRSIKETMKRREFSWRMPRETVKEEENENKWTKPVANFLKDVFDKIDEWKKAVKDYIDELIDKIFPESDTEGEGRDWKSWARLTFYFLCAVITVLLVFYLVKRLLAWKRGRILIETGPVLKRVDLTDENVSAGDLPMDRWLSLAGELIEEGNFRLALRALYLATLAHLAERQLISIAKYKSNRDYETELKRRAHEKSELLGMFAQTVAFFDRVWYGMHEVEKSDVDRFAKNQERISVFASQ